MASIHDPIETLEQDCLVHQNLAKDILKKLASPECPPALGIYGSWGTGKSSLLNLIRLLNQHPDHGYRGILEFIAIDAWLYESTGNLFIPVMRALANLIEKSGASTAEPLAMLKRVFAITAMLAAQWVLKSNLQLEMQNITDFRKQVHREMSLDDINRLVDEVANAQSVFRQAIERINQASGTIRIVFLIDNLDRCSPENVLTLLESVQNFLAAPGCAWVFAVDSEILASYIDKKYEGTAIDGYSYLDKIIPEQYHIPPPSLIQNQDRLNRLMARAMEGQNETYLPADWKRYAQIPRLLAPRRLLKSARKFVEIATDNELGLVNNPDMAFALILLYHAWPDFYERLSSDSPRHVSGVLANFAPGGGPVQAWDNGAPLQATPLPDRYTASPEITHFLRHAFDGLNDIPRLAEELCWAMAWLRQKGLP